MVNNQNFQKSKIKIPLKQKGNRAVQNFISLQISKWVNQMEGGGNEEILLEIKVRELGAEMGNKQKVY